MQVYYKQRDYWPFVWCVRYISPQLASHVEQVRSLPAICRVVCKYFTYHPLISMQISSVCDRRHVYVDTCLNIATLF